MQGFRTSPTHQEGYLPPRGVALAHGGQRPKTQIKSIRLTAPTIISDTLVTGMPQTGLPPFGLTPIGLGLPPIGQPPLD